MRYPTGNASGEMMNLKTKNILTALVLATIAIAVYIAAVMQALSK